MRDFARSEPSRDSFTGNKRYRIAIYLPPCIKRNIRINAQLASGAIACSASVRLGVPLRKGITIADRGLRVKYKHIVMHFCLRCGNINTIGSILVVFHGIRISDPLRVKSQVARHFASEIIYTGERCIRVPTVENISASFRSGRLNHFCVFLHRTDRINITVAYKCNGMLRLRDHRDRDHRDRGYPLDRIRKGIPAFYTA